jgi:hypothetical protein
MEQGLVSDIVEAVASSEGVKPEELEVVLGDYIDLDAVNQLSNHSNSTWTLSFELPEHSVTGTSDGAILVDNQREQDSISS